ncbi:TetR/AcrR family transcriptional regulator [Phenylobacterium sp.]|uniref:TetR/AcrR family transcriptional regulator n=1 Tax=Phenylobacterium sp. TaxID=1871053 RepID=UPI0035B1803A
MKYGGCIRRAHIGAGAGADDLEAPRRRYHVGNLRAELMRHAREILQEAGLGGLNLRALAARAGIAPGSVYHHYASKAALLAGLAAEGFGDLQERLEEAAREARQGERIRTCARAYFAFARAQPTIYALMFDPAVMTDGEVRCAMARAFAVLEELVGVAITPIRPRTPDELHKIALAVWACGHGAASMTLGQQDDYDDLMEDVIQGLDALFRRD